MTNIPKLNTPSELPLVSSPTEESVAGFSGAGGGEIDKNEKVKMKKQLGLLEGVAIILGIIFGSGKILNEAK